MKNWTGKAVALGLVLALGTTGCTDKKAEAAAAAKAKADEDTARAKVRASAQEDVHCLAALKWQEKLLAASDLGPVSAYQDYYTRTLQDTLSDNLFIEPPAPPLSRATVQQYMDWAYPHEVETYLTAADAADQNAAAAPAGKNARGYATVVACIRKAAEGGTGPLAADDQAKRTAQIEKLRDRLEAKGA